MPYNLVKAFAEAILEGNETYCNLSNTNQLEDVNLSIPDAIHAVKVCSRGLKEWVIIHELVFKIHFKDMSILLIKSFHLN